MLNELVRAVRYFSSMQQLTLREIECISRIQSIITGRNVAKVIFLHLLAILFTGGVAVCLSACWDTTPPRSRPPQARYPPRADPPEQTAPEQTPPPQSRHPPGPDTPRSRHPQSRHHPPPTPTGADTPHGSRHPPEQTPLGADRPPPGKQTPAYGLLRAAGTHPTRMHSDEKEMRKIKDFSRC